MPRGSDGGGRGQKGSGRGRGRGRQAHNGTAQSEVPSPALLTSLIKRSWTVESLFQTFSTYEGHFNHIHLSACWNSLGHQSRSTRVEGTAVHADALQSLVQKTSLVVTTCSEVRARQLANIAHGVAKSGLRQEHVGGLMTALAAALKARLAECNPQELANVAWAFAKMRHVDADFFGKLAETVEGCAMDLNPQEIANTAWAFATAGHSDTRLWRSLAPVVELRVIEFTTQGLSNTAWAFAKAGHVDARLFAMMGGRARERLDDFNSQDLANTALAFAKAGVFDAELFEALAKSAVEWHLESLSAQGLATTIWAFAKAGLTDHNKLFTAFAKSILQRGINDFNSQDIAHTAWAFAKACHSDRELFGVLAQSAGRFLQEFNAQDLMNTAWGFAKVGHSAPELFAGIAGALRDRRLLDDLTATQMANVAWAFAKAGQVDEQLFAALARSAQGRLRDFSASDLANVAWAFANAGTADAALFIALGKAAEPLLEAFTDEELDNTEWALSRAGQREIARDLRRRRPQRAGSGAGSAVDTPKCGRIVIAGGGIGGAAVAVALQKRGFEVVVLEADADFDSRQQGYGLTIQGYGSTTQALGIGLAEDDAPSTSHYTFSSEGHILGFFGEAFGKSRDRDEKENSGRFIHIPRQKLRSRLLDEIQPDTIMWNSKLESFECSGEEGKEACPKTCGGVTVKLTDGRTLDAALLVGSDGIFSSVRRQLKLPGDRLNFVGLVVVLGIVRDDEKAEATPLTDRRIFETVDGVTRIYAMPFTTTSTMWQLSFPASEKAAQRLVRDKAVLREEILARCGAWHDPIPGLIRCTPLESMSGYPVYDRDLLNPAALRAAATKTRSRVTLIGDAAHPMTPFRAQGANQALADAVLFAEVLAEGLREHPEAGAGIDAALPLFERRMLSRSGRVVQGSREKAKEMHSRLAMQPARKVQREVATDMQRVIARLRDKGIGAQSASDPRGLDAVVAEAIAEAHPGSAPSVPARGPERSGAGEESAQGASPNSSRFWGYADGAWHKCLLVKRKRSGKHKVQWPDGTTSSLDADCVQPRLKKARA